jgi:pyruvate,water dikinase
MYIKLFYSARDSLFHSARALVVEVGGMMTHGSVICPGIWNSHRYGINNVTKILKDG